MDDDSSSIGEHACEGSARAFGHVLFCQCGVVTGERAWAIVGQEAADIILGRRRCILGADDCTLLDVRRLLRWNHLLAVDATADCSNESQAAEGHTHALSTARATGQIG